MQLTSLSRTRGLSFSLALALASAASASAQSRVVLPAGSVVLVRTNVALESATAQVGQSFETTVEDNVGVDEYTIIPAGSRIRGVITAATAATRQQSGVIDVSFDRLMLADGSTVPITGKLTSTDTAERRQIKSNPNARVVLVGARGGIGAAIAGAGSGKSSQNILAALGGMLSEGSDVSVPAGTQLAVELGTALSMRAGNRIRGNAAGSTIYTAADRVMAAQQALARLNYYRGAINGRLDDATRLALFQFQADKRLTSTGNLDGVTASALGINLDAAVAGAMLSAEASSTVRRDAQSLLARDRSELSLSSSGRLDPNRAYAQTDLELLFALSAFADNSAVYEQIVRTGGNRNAAVLAGKSLIAAARRVDTALQNARTTPQLQNAWASVRRQLATIDG